MQIHSIKSFNGKNIYSFRPVIKMILDIGELYKLPTKDIPGFNQTLLGMFPGLKEHHCSLGYEGGFEERLNEGTYIGHVTEHLILEIQKLMGYAVFFGKTRTIKDPRLFYIVYEYKNERCGIECGRAAVKITTALAAGEGIDLENILEELRKITAESEMGPSTQAIFTEAVKRGIPVSRVGNGSLLQLGYGKYSRLIESSLSDLPSCITVDIAGNKHLTKQILKDHRIPVPFGDIAYAEESAVEISENIGYPVVLKPYDANQGKGVTLDINNETQVRVAYREAMRFSRAVIVEKFVKGKDYRVLVVGDQISSVCERKPPFVKGDGKHTIKELVDIENENILRGDDHEKPLTRIKIDSVSKQVLERVGLDEKHIPFEGELIRLRDNGNLSTGGTARECNNEIHPYNISVAIKAAKVLGLDIAGIDIVTEDISAPLNYLNGAVIEVNAGPGLRMHLYPTEGTPRNVAADIVEMMFPSEKINSIPVIAITGTNGKTTTTRLVRHTIAITGKKVGMTSTSGVFIGNECVLEGDNTGPVSAKLVLSNTGVEAAVLETARGGIIKKGLGYDLADVGVILNISEDHIGMDGLNTLEDLAYVKSLVIEAVKPDGFAVLNADDTMIEYFLNRVVSKVILFSKSSSNPLICEHLKSGGVAVYTEGNSIFIHCNGSKRELIEVEDIPITYGGMVECNIENALAASAALHAINTPLKVIRLGLKSFKPDILTNPGRFNIFEMGDFKVMLDYGHNPAGYSAVISFLQKMNAKRLVGIIGVPGDRLDRNIQEVGQMCGKVFSKVYIKEDGDLRGRAPGEVAGILFESLIKSGFENKNIEIIYSELKALETAMLHAEAGDLIIMLYEEFEPAVELINKFKEEIEENEIQQDIYIC